MLTKQVQEHIAKAVDKAGGTTPLSAKLTKICGKKIHRGMVHSWRTGATAPSSEPYLAILKFIGKIK